MSEQRQNIIEQVAYHLGHPWKFNHLHAPSDWRYEIIDGQGRVLFFRVDGKQFRISGFLPAGYRGDYTSIGVSLTRTPKAIAADIIRRLLPQYLEAYAQAIAYQKARHVKAERLHHIARALCKGTGGHIQSHSRAAHTIRFDEGSAELWRGEDVSMTLNSITPEQAIKVVAALRGK